MNVKIPAYTTIAIFMVMIIIQLALAFGAPIAEISWGGQYEGVLPNSLRIASLISAGIFVLIISAVLDKSQLYDLYSNSRASTIIIWLFAMFLLLNTLGNLASQSSLERAIMTPLSAVASICMFLVARTDSTEKTSSELGM